MDAELKAYLDDMRAGMMAQIGEHFEVFETRLLDRIAVGETRVEARIDVVEDKLGKRIDAVEVKLGKRIDGVEDRLGKRIDLQAMASLDEAVKLCTWRITLRKRRY